MPLNLPNLLTWLRILFIPLVIGVFYLPGGWLTPVQANLLATAFFVVAAVTDWLDGYLARKLNQTSAFGAFLDPVADKLMVAAALIVLVDLDRNDLWESGGSTLLRYLEEHPEVERRLMESPIDELNGADQFYRAGVLDLRGHYAEARELERLAHLSVYTPEYQAATQQQIESTLQLLAAHTGPIFDLASGRGGLALRMLEHLPNPVVMTDFSLRVLREDRRRLIALGLYDRVSLLAFDARRTPFRDGAVGLMTTYAGLGNIEQPGSLLRELRRAVSGRFLALSFFCPEDDQANGDLLRQAGMEQMLFRRLALQHFAEAGWQVSVRGAIEARVAPTPRSALIPNATVDGFPVAETVLEFCLLDAE